jgi:hypothetical protein
MTSNRKAVLWGLAIGVLVCLIAYPIVEYRTEASPSPELLREALALQDEISTSVTSGTVEHRLPVQAHFLVSAIKYKAENTASRGEFVGWAGRPVIRKHRFMRSSLILLFPKFALDADGYQDIIQLYSSSSETLKSSISNANYVEHMGAIITSNTVEAFGPVK